LVALCQPPRATEAAFDALFLSGFSFGASFYGLPDEGYIAWSDLMAATHRIRSVTPGSHLLVDMDDGYGDPGIAAHAAATLESMGASGIILEDQLRPKKCGHLDGKQVMELDGFMEKLHRVLTARRDLVVVAHTDAAEPEERLRRARAIDRTAADAILVDGLSDTQFLQILRREVKKPIVFNQIAGGKSKSHGLGELRQAGVGLVIYSTPCLFAAHSAIDTTLSDLKSQDGKLPEPTPHRVELGEVSRHLKANLVTRHQQGMKATSRTNDLPLLRGGSFPADAGVSGAAPSKAYNADPKPFYSTKTANVILEKERRGLEQLEVMKSGNQASESDH
jgi:2-methylisocitrate lyase-like PEP mutase family enzyme